MKGGVATKWGTKEEYISCIKAAKALGIVIYVDAVLNHKAGADFTEPFMVTEVAEEDRTKEVSGLVRAWMRAMELTGSQEEIEGWTGFNFPGRKGKYSKMDWHHVHFTGVDWDARAEKKAIFKIQGDGKDWAKDVDSEKGSFGASPLAL